MVMAPSSNSSEQGGSGWVSKPPRLRTACTQCHAAKVRCSSDHEGCRRCKSLGLRCDYVVSMVGRTPKRRRRRTSLELQPDKAVVPPPERHLPAVSNATTDHADTACSTIPSLQSSLQSLTPAGSNDTQLLDILDDQSWAFTGVDDGWTFPPATSFEDGFSMPPDLQQSSYINETQSALTTAVSASYPPVLPASIAGLFPMTPESSGTQPDAEPVQTGQEWYQFGHIVALCKMVRMLESQMHSQPTAVDEVMRLNQTCIRHVSQISSNSEYMQCRSCPPLISTIMELIVTRYEDIAKNPGQGRMSSTSASKPPSAPSLQFGVFELDDEEQTLIRNRIIRKEAQKCIAIIQPLKQLLHTKASTANDASSQAYALGGWYDGMEKRMTDLIAALASSS